MQEKMYSRTFKKVVSIRVPKLKRSTRGKSLCTEIQKRYSSFVFKSTCGAFEEGGGVRCYFDSCCTKILYQQEICSRHGGSF